MAKYTNVVRFLVKEGQQEAFESRFSEARPWKRLLQHILAKTSERTYVGYGLWENEEAMVTAKPDMIALLDSARDLLEEISPELGVTDPVSGTVVFELKNSWKCMSASMMLTARSPLMEAAIEAGFK